MYCELYIDLSDDIQIECGPTVPKRKSGCVAFVSVHVEEELIEPKSNHNNYMS